MAYARVVVALCVLRCQKTAVASHLPLILTTIADGLRTDPDVDPMGVCGRAEVADVMLAAQVEEVLNSTRTTSRTHRRPRRTDPVLHVARKLFPPSLRGVETMKTLEVVRLHVEKCAREALCDSHDGAFCATSARWRRR